ncbi:MAG: hypothetical protein ACHQJ6_02460 [Candidatus Berkiellales bacterium]
MSKSNTTENGSTSSLEESDRLTSLDFLNAEHSTLLKAELVKKLAQDSEYLALKEKAETLHNQFNQLFLQYSQAYDNPKKEAYKSMGRVIRTMEAERNKFNVQAMQTNLSQKKEKNDEILKKWEKKLAENPQLSPNELAQEQCETRIAFAEVKASHQSLIRAEVLSELFSPPKEWEALLLASG